jgi:hypothetical protein
MDKPIHLFSFFFVQSCRHRRRYYFGDSRWSDDALVLKPSNTLSNLKHVGDFFAGTNARQGWRAVQLRWRRCVLHAGTMFYH